MLYERNGLWYADIRVASRRIRVSTRSRDRAEAEGIAERIKLGVAAPDDWREFRAATPVETLSFLRRSRERALRRDRIRGRESALSLKELEAIFARSRGRCEVTSIPFSLDKREGTFRRPFAPTLDRIDNRSGYTFANCRLVVLAANIGINEWGEAVFRRLAIGFLSASGGTLPGHTTQQEEFK